MWLCFTKECNVVFVDANARQGPTLPFVRIHSGNNSKIVRERKMRTNFFCTNFLNTPRGPGHPAKIPGTSQVPLFETQGRQSFEGEHEVFDHHPFPWKTPTPPGGLRTQKVNLCVLFSCLNSISLYLYLLRNQNYAQNNFDLLCDPLEAAKNSCVCICNGRLIPK